ncbi:hypothetical protein PILCRDRAFT_823394 [Piloderma croceum F 1598]|uniref:Uncharacterized protein n=1 Tax=Piloderma croceum (strain F 1598) TaxID=765440 RepID=A0A0C3AZS4_PILCF|nr:hypothetical protein PILCRDRAFT_823394 [Piloderma croceum F 1598]
MSTAAPTSTAAELHNLTEAMRGDGDDALGDGSHPGRRRRTTPTTSSPNRPALRAPRDAFEPAVECLARTSSRFGIEGYVVQSSTDPTPSQSDMPAPSSPSTTFHHHHLQLVVLTLANRLTHADVSRVGKKFRRRPKA